MEKEKFDDFDEFKKEKIQSNTKFSNKCTIILFVLLLIIIGVGVYYNFFLKNKKQEENSNDIQNVVQSDNKPKE